MSGFECVRETPDPPVVVPDSVAVPSGSNSKVVTFTTTVVATPTTLTITATQGGVSKTITVTLNPYGSR